ncbi:host cell division inhibitor Icd-like protein [Pluralibacter gergoviae]|nr:host cell division inhibitor Icd-like protein [Pluralibacter gergoviae]ELD4273687.1 host cell division inhibitor Icd-like protein [Pluralibacter gergoviae]ELD4279299.1 host cell division inhibitor Icd-like protein [Pluralibacter gergoviae]ELD4318770.1 host cell division inhibitor Icd-like protein [Pluralibacter gergoviae]ELD4343849.1 host cell division inhibitor Icd-like protein [Pluralibacter gergoviae]
MAGTQHTQTHPKYQYRFMALDRADRQAKPCKIIVEATSEHEARKVLSAHYILSLASVLPVQEVRHA